MIHDIPLGCGRTVLSLSYSRECVCMYAAIVPIQFVHKFVKPKGEIPSQLDRSEGID